MTSTFIYIVNYRSIGSVKRSAWPIGQINLKITEWNWRKFLELPRTKGVNEHLEFIRIQALRFTCKLGQSSTYIKRQFWIQPCITWFGYKTWFGDKRTWNRYLWQFWMNETFSKLRMDHNNNNFNNNRQTPATRETSTSANFFFHNDNSKSDQTIITWINKAK